MPRSWNRSPSTARPTKFLLRNAKSKTVRCSPVSASGPATWLHGIVPDPLMKANSGRWRTSGAAATRNLGECLAQSRHVLEGQWGLETLEIPQSQVCALPAFHWFTAHLLANLPRLRDAYNSAVDAYRRVNRVRSANHPVPNLATDGEWIEAPFWLWSSASPRRRRLFVRRRARLA